MSCEYTAPVMTAGCLGCGDEVCGTPGGRGVRVRPRLGRRETTSRSLPRRSVPDTFRYLAIPHDTSGHYGCSDLPNPPRPSPPCARERVHAFRRHEAVAPLPSHAPRCRRSGPRAWWNGQLPRSAHAFEDPSSGTHSVITNRTRYQAPLFSTNLLAAAIP